MSYRLVVTATAERQLARLPAKVAPAIVEFMTGPLVENPQVVGKELQGPLAGQRGARRGNYRVVYRVEDKTVIVLQVAHRSHVYRPR